MKKERILLILLTIITLALAGCSNPDIQNEENSSKTNLTDPVVENSSGNPVDQGELSSEDILPTEPDGGSELNPTPSPIFEQNYGPNEISDRDYSDFKIITLLPPDAIPAFTFPEYYFVKEANQEYDPDELVIGVEFNGDARAYSVSLLSRHEIVNDTVGGIHLAVTW